MQMSSFEASISARRNRRRLAPTIAGLATAAAVAYGSYRILQWWWSQKDEKSEETTIVFNNDTASTSPRRDCLQRQERMRTCREETAKALVGFLATARRVLDEATDTSAATKQLKELRAAAALLKTENSNIDSNEQQERLWNEVKRKSVARLIATAYALSILFLVLSVQVHLLGGRLFRVQGSDDAKDDIASRHEFVLTHLFESFFETGIERLVRAVERAVEQCWSDCNVLDPAFLEMNVQTIDRLLQKVRFQVESETSLLSFLLSDQHSSESSNNVIADSTATTILDETWDLLESPVFADAQRHCLDTTFTVLKEQHWGTIFGTDGTTLQPLATVLTKLKKTSKTFYEPSSLGSTNSYVAVIQTLSSVVELCDVSFN